MCCSEPGGGVAVAIIASRAPGRGAFVVRCIPVFDNRTMGAVECEKHGTHPGPLCCDHLRMAAEQVGADITFDVYRYDVLGDGVEFLAHLLCEECASKFNLRPSQLIPDDVWADEDRFPYVCPTCFYCLVEWSEKHNRRFHLIDSDSNN